MSLLHTAIHTWQCQLPNADLGVIDTHTPHTPHTPQTHVCMLHIPYTLVPTCVSCPNSSEVVIAAMSCQGFATKGAARCASHGGSVLASDQSLHTHDLAVGRTHQGQPSPTCDLSAKEGPAVAGVELNSQDAAVTAAATLKPFCYHQASHCRCHWRPARAGFKV